MKRKPTQRTDPVLTIGRNIGTAWDLSTKLDEQISSNTPQPAKGTLEAALNRTCDRTELLEAAIPAFRATTLGGALVDVIHASRHVGLAMDELHRAGDDIDEFEIKRHLRNINAMLYSAVSALREAAPGIFEACAGGVYMPDHSDPHRALNGKNSQEGKLCPSM